MKVRIAKKARPKGIVVLRDSRESHPIAFKREEHIVGTERIKLHVGDYQALYPDGSRSFVVFERKSVPDLWCTMTKGHSRFMNELALSKKMEVRLVLIVEAPFSAILSGFYRSRYPGTAMVKKLHTLFHVYGLPSVFCTSREDMSNYIAWSFISEGLHSQRIKKGRK